MFHKITDVLWQNISKICDIETPPDIFHERRLNTKKKSRGHVFTKSRDHVFRKRDWPHEKIKSTYVTE